LFDRRPGGERLMRGSLAPVNEDAVIERILARILKDGVLPPREAERLRTDLKQGRVSGAHWIGYADRAAGPPAPATNDGKAL